MKNITFFQRIIKMFFKIRFVRGLIQYSYLNWFGLGQENVYKDPFNVTTKTYLMVTRLGLSDITCNSPPLLEGSNLFRLYWSISSSLCKIDESSLDSLIPIIEVFDCCAIKQISLILGSRLLIFKCKICKPFFLTIFYLELLSALQQPKLLHSEGIVGSP